MHFSKITVETILCLSNLGLKKVKMLKSLLEGVYLLEACLRGVVGILLKKLLI